MHDRLADALAQATLPSPWEIGNETLYGMCRQHPLHTDLGSVISKVWLIGRSYAAAIERRRKKAEPNDVFYVQSVGPKIVASEIDSWIASARRLECVGRSTFDAMLEVHRCTTRLFSDISGLEKRSLASKYLHFHVPAMFYIFDTRAVKALRILRQFISFPGRPRSAAGPGDKEYRTFAEKCLVLQEHIETSYGRRLSPRQLDNIFLWLHSTREEAHDNCPQK